MTNRRRRSLSVIIGALLLLLVAGRAPAAVTSASFTSYVQGGQAVLPNWHEDSPYRPWPEVTGRNATTEGYIVVFGLNIVSDSGQRLFAVNVGRGDWIWPGQLAIDSTVVTNRSGTILGVTSGVGRVTIDGGAAIPANDDGGNAGDDFFVAVRLDDTARGSVFPGLGAQSSVFIARGITVGPFDPEADDVVPGEVSSARLTCQLDVADFQPQVHSIYSDDANLNPLFPHWHPGEMIRPRYDRDPQVNQLSPYPVDRHLPQVLPWGVRVPVLAIAAAQRNVHPWFTVRSEAEYLSSIRVTVTDTGEGTFDPNRAFRGEGDRPGITLWRNAALTSRVPVVYSGGGLFTQTGDNPRQWTLTLSVPAQSEPLSPTTTGDYNWYLAAELRADDGDPFPGALGGEFKIWIAPGDIVFGPVARPRRYAGIREEQVKTLHANLHLADLAPARLDPVPAGAPADPAANVIPVVGLNVAGGPAFPGLRLESVDLEVLVYDDHFDPREHLAAVSLWRDTKTAAPPPPPDPGENDIPGNGENGDEPPGNGDNGDDPPPPAPVTVGRVGMFDVADTPVPATATPWVFDRFDAAAGAAVYRCRVIVDDVAADRGHIPPDDFHAAGAGTYRGLDFYLAVRPGARLPYDSRFRFRVPDGGVRLTGPGPAGRSVSTLTTREIRGNVAARLESLVAPGSPGLAPDSPPTAMLRADLADHNPDRRTWLEGLTVEFHSDGGFSTAHLRSFDPLAAYTDGEGWSRATNPAASAACGVVFYRDAALTQPLRIARFRRYAQRGVPPDYPPAPVGWQFEFVTDDRPELPATVYVAVRTSAQFPPGGSFNAAVVGWGRTEADWETWGSRALPIVDDRGIRSAVYARGLTGFFHPADPGLLAFTLATGYDGNTLAWSPPPGVTAAAFERYEIYRYPADDPPPPGVLPAPLRVFDDFNRRQWVDRRHEPDGPEDGVDYVYRVVMRYRRAGQDQELASAPLGGRLHLLPDRYLPRILRVVAFFSPAAGRYVSRIQVHWFDESHVLENLRADGFIIERRLHHQSAFRQVGLLPAVPPLFIDPYYTFNDVNIPDGTTAERSPEYRLRVVRGALPDEDEDGNGAPGDEPPPVRYLASQPTAASHITHFEDRLFKDGGGGSGCFIATAAWGSPLAPEVTRLRRFRDRVLARTRPGRWFIGWYYRHSPPAADFIAARPGWRFAARQGLRPLTWLARVF